MVVTPLRIVATVAPFVIAFAVICGVNLMFADRIEHADLVARISGESEVAALDARMANLEAQLDSLGHMQLEIRAKLASDVATLSATPDYAPDLQDIRDSVDLLRDDLLALGTELDQLGDSVTPQLTFTESPLPIVTVYSASWCAPCQRMKADKAKKKFDGLDVRFIEKNLPGYVTHLPTIEYMDASGKTQRIIGYDGQSTIDKLKANAR